MKKITNAQVVGQRGELIVSDATLAMGFNYTGNNRLEAGTDGFIELRDPATGRALAKWVGVQVKTKSGGTYSNEDETGFDYLIRQSSPTFSQTTISRRVRSVRKASSIVFAIAPPLHYEIARGRNQSRCGG